MVSLQDCLQINRVHLDKWTTREQLCLLSAVIKIGDQNWVVVSRDVKLLCGANRPTDWFSQKSCAAQYEELLRNAENLRSDNKFQVDASLDGSLENTGKALSDLLLKQLTEVRIKELKMEIQKDQEEYAKLHSELNSLKNGHLTDEEVIEMWKEMQKEQELQRIEEMKMENLLREREQRNQDMQRNWRPILGTAVSLNNYQSQNQDEKVLGSHDVTGVHNKPALIPNPHQPQQATSPLLSSLLKSPTPNATSPTLGTAAHVAAPTITSLLTGGVINPNQPVITLKNSIPPGEASQLLTRPISGPPLESLSFAGNIIQTSLSPSKSAPTLSMLLEKNKGPCATSNTGSHTITALPSDANSSKTTSSISDSNNEEVPMDIEEDVSTTIASSTDLIEGSDGDANEEQQLLEVFKNIGNIDDLEDIDVAAVIDEEVDFLKSVEEEPADDTGTEKIDSNHLVQLLENKSSRKNVEESVADLKRFEVSITEAKGTADTEEVNKQSREEIESKIPTSSSDDSNDDIPLSTLGGSNINGCKDITNKNEEKLSNTSTNEQLNEKQTDGNEKNDNIDENCVIDIDNSPEENIEETNAPNNIKEPELKSFLSKKSPELTISEIIVIPTDDESSDDNKCKTIGKNNIQEQQPDDDDLGEGTDNKTRETATRKVSEDVHQSPDGETIENISSFIEQSKKIEKGDLASTLDDFSDISATNIEKNGINTSPKLSEPIQKLYQDINMDHKLGDESNLSQTLAKAPAIRKLRERDRSESPIIANDEDTTASELSITQRSRRRNSSTPINDSIPNSPASSDREDRDAKASKKSLMSIYNSVIGCKHAAAFQRAQTVESAKFNELCNRNIDFQMIKKNIEIGAIRNVQELQRDLCLLCQNGIMAFESNSANYKTVLEFQKDFQNIKEFVIRVGSVSGGGNTIRHEKDSKETKTSISLNTSSTHSTGIKVRGSSRKSQRITSS